MPLQVPGAVQAGQSVCEVHPRHPQERQHRVLQAQEQPAVGGVRAGDGTVRLNPEAPNAPKAPHPPAPTLKPENESSVHLACCVVVFSFSLFLSDLPRHHHSCNHVPLLLFFWQ